MNRIVPLLALCLSALIAETGLAHRVDVSTWVEGGRMFVQGQFGSGKPVQNGAVFVYDSQNRLLLQGASDINGEFSFPIPRRSDLLIVIDAGSGHKGRRKIPAKELDTDSTAGRECVDRIATSPRAFSPDMESRMEAILDRKLKPLYAMLAKRQNRGVALTDILGGIGYIVGLIGLAAYLKTRKRDA